MTWQVPKIWEDGDCWIVGGGYSLVEQFKVPQDVVNSVMEGKLPMGAYSPYMAAIHGKHIIGINAAYLLGDWIDFLFFGDKRFFLKNRKALAKFNGLKISCHSQISRGAYAEDQVKFLAKDKARSKGITPLRDKISWNANSGAAAISIAVHTGAKRIFLLGFDMALKENHQHFHRHYVKKDGKLQASKLPFHRHLLGFPTIAKQTKALGVEVYNVSHNSAIQCFKKLTLEEALEL